MMTLMTVVLAAAALNANAAARVTKQIESTCRFTSSEGAADAKFIVQYLVFHEDRGREEIRVVTPLNLGGRHIHAKFESCILRRNGPFCAHEDNGGSYELRPAIVNETDKVESVRLVRWMGADLQLLAEAACQ